MTVPSALWAQADNDNFAEAEIIGGNISQGIVFGDSTGCTKEAGEFNHGGDAGGVSTWYEWTAPADGIVTFDTVGSEVDTVLGVYKGDDYGTLASVAQNDEGFSTVSGVSQVRFVASANTIYHIAVDGRFGQTGIYFLNWNYFSAGSFHFTTDLYKVNESDKNASSNGDRNMTGDSGGLFTITRESGFDGAVKVAVGYSYFAPTNTYFTNFTKETNLCFTNVVLGIVTNDCRENTNNLAYRPSMFGSGPVITNYEGCTEFNFITNLDNSITVEPTNCPITNLVQVQTNVTIFGVTNFFTNLVVVMTDVATNITRTELVPVCQADGIVTLTFSNYQMSASLNMPLCYDTNYIPGKAIGLTILNTYFDNGEGDYTNYIKAPALSAYLTSATIRVAEFQGRAGTVINFERSNVRCSEANPFGRAYVSVYRVGTTGCSVKYITDNRGTTPDVNHEFNLRAGSDYATPDDDFTGETGTLTWAAGGNSEKKISFAINNDGTPEFNEDFIVTLYDVEGEASLGEQSVITVTLSSDDTPAGGVDEGYLTENAAGTVPAFNPLPGANQPVQALVVQADNRTVIGGEFTSFNGQTVRKLARLNTDGSLDTGYISGNGISGGVGNPYVAAVILDETNRVIAGGNFSTFNGNARSRIVRLTSTGAMDASFDPQSGFDANAQVFALALLPGNRIVAGGQFSKYNGTNRVNVAVLNENGSLDATFDEQTGPNGTVYAVAVQNDGKILIGGSFTTVKGFDRGRIARLNADGSVDTTFNPQLGVDPGVGGSVVRSIAVQPDGRILIGGNFRVVDQAERRSIARLESNGTVDPTFDPGTGFDNTVNTLRILGDGKILVGGNFTLFNGTRRLGLARLFTDGTLDTGFMDTAYNQYAGVPNGFLNPSTDLVNKVFAVGVQNDGNVMVGGTFRIFGGGSSRLSRHPRLNVVRLVGGITDGPGNIQFANSSLSGDENDANTYISLERINGHLGLIGATVYPGSRVAGSGSAEYGNDFSYGQSLVGDPDVVKPVYDNSYPFTWMLSDGSFGPNNISLTVNPNLFLLSGLDDIAIHIPRDGTIEPDESADLEMAIPRGTETFYLGGENIPLGAALGRRFSSVTILDGDKRPGTLSFSSATYATNEMNGTYEVTVMRTDGSDGDVSVSYSTSNGTATAGSTRDYLSTSGTLDFGQTETVKTFTITLKDDTTLEPDETINLQLSAPTGGAVLGLSNAVFTIIDNELASGHVNFSNTVYKPSENGGTVTLTVERQGGSVGTMTVDYATTNGTALAGQDYTGTSGTLSWNANEVASKTITIPLLDDGLVEGDETFVVRLLNARTNGIVNAQVLGVKTNASVIVVDDDFYGTVQFNVTNYTVNENSGAATITVVRQGGSAQTVTVNYAVTNGTAVAPGDYGATSGTLTFNAGELSKTFDVPIRDNGSQQGVRVANLVLSTPNPAFSLGVISNATITIVDDETTVEPPGTLDVFFNAQAGANDVIYSAALQPDGKILIGGDFTLVNGVTRNRIARLNKDGTLDTRFSGTTLGADSSIRAILALTNVFDQAGPVMVAGNFQTINGTNRHCLARLNLDGTVDTTFDPGSGSDGPIFALAETRVNGQRKILVAGSFTFVDGHPMNNLARFNDDGTVDTNFNATIGLNGPVYALAVQPDGKVLAGGDFTTANNADRKRIVRLNVDGSLDQGFNPANGFNNVVRALAVQLDGKILAGGAFTNFNGSALNRVARLNADGTQDQLFTPGLGADDAVYTLALQVDGRILLGGEFRNASGVTRNRLTRLYADGTVDPTINFGAGANSFVASVLLQPDGKIVLAGGFTQYDGFARQRIARVYGGAMDGYGRVEFTQANYVVSETATNALITLRRRGGTKGENSGLVTIDFNTANLTAEAGFDYTALSTNVSFPTGETFQNLVIPVFNDDLIENDEQVQLTLSIPTNGQPAAALGDQPFALLTIRSDDSAVSFANTTFRGQENAVNQAVTLTLNRVGDLQKTSTVEVVTLPGGTATPFADYLRITNLITFLPGEGTKDTFLPIINDSEIEGDETVNVGLQNPLETYLFAPLQAVATIGDDDIGPGTLVFSAGSFSVVENGGMAAIQLVRTNGTFGSISVAFTTANGSALAGTDYSPTNGILTFIDGETSKTILVPILDDPNVEGNLIFKLMVSNIVGGSVLAAPLSTDVTILDDEVGVAFSTPSYVVSEGSNVVVTVRRDNASIPMTVDYVSLPTLPASAVSNVDYVAVSGTLSFAVNEKVKTFTIQSLEDGIIEGDESFQIRLLNPSPGAQLSTPNLATVTIVDNDSAFNFAAASFSASESGGDAVITVIRTNGSSGLVHVSYGVSPGTVRPATIGVDFSAASGTLTFQDGETVKTFTVPITSDKLAEGDETVTVTLSNPDGGAQLGTLSTATLVIVDDDAAISFAAPTYFVSEGGVSATVQVVRTFDTNVVVTVDYAATDGTASAQDYAQTAGTLVFGAGETSKTFTVGLIDDTLEEGNETVLLKLSNLQGSGSVVAPAAATLTIVDNDGSYVIPAGSQLVAETNGTVNGIIDTNETVTILFALRNESLTNTGNVISTLQVTNGVTAPSALQNYGVLPALGYSVSRPFTFTATGTNGAIITPTFVLTDNGTNIGRVTFSYVIGTTQFNFTNGNAITIVDALQNGGSSISSGANPYPSVINVSSVPGNIQSITATLTNLSHAYPQDVDVLLVSPAGQKVMLMSDAAGVGSTPLVNRTFTFTDGAAAMPRLGPVASGSFHPTDFETAENLPSPAPSLPYGTNMANFLGNNPNGGWSLYVADDSYTDAGQIQAGWWLSIATGNPLQPFTDLSIGAVSVPASVVVVSNTITYTLHVTNHGPSAATGIQLTNVLPVGAAFVGASGSYSTNGGLVTCQIGSLAKDATATVTITVRLNEIGAVLNAFGVTGNETDPNPGNNGVTVTSDVQSPTADLVLSMVATANPVPLQGTLTYTLTVSNLGPADAAATVVTNTLPPSLADIVVSATPSAALTVAGNDLIFSFPSIAAGSAGVITISGRPTAAGTLTNAAAAVSTVLDPLKANNIASLKSTVQAPQVQVQVGDDVLLLQWPEAATGYILQVSTDLISWTNYAGSIATGGGLNTVSIDTTAGTSVFFRLVKP